MRMGWANKRSLCYNKNRKFSTENHASQHSTKQSIQENTVRDKKKVPVERNVTNIEE